MNAQPYGQPVSGTYPPFNDPQASTAFYPPSPLPAQPSLRGLRILVILMSVVALVTLALTLTGFKVTPSGATTQADRLQNKVTSLQHQVDTLSAKYGTLSGQYTTLKAAQGKTASQVGAINAAGVLNFQPFSGHVCQVTATAPGGRPYNTGVPCNG